MIRILFIAPYDSMKPTIEAVLEEYNAPEPISASVRIMTPEQIAGAKINSDVVVARGLSYEAIKRHLPDMLVIPMRISGYDIIQATHTAVSRFHPTRIAILGARSMIYSADKMNGIFDAEIRLYQADEPEQLSGELERAQADGCDCFIGGLSLINLSGGLVPSILIETGKATISACIDEAIRTVLSTRVQQKRSARYKTILDHSKEGIISLNEDGRIISINMAARGWLSLEMRPIVGKYVYELIPPTEGYIAEVFEKAMKIENEVLQIGGKLLTFDFIPTLHRNHVTGVILFIQSVNKIQEDESLIRKKIVSKNQQAKYQFEDITYRSKEMASALEMARIYATVDSSVLIVGESGTGKELVAQSIHNASARKNAPFIAINCAALSESLLESELFGYSEGAFTGALKGGKEGLFEAAHGGTIFLDEISEIPLSFQSKLLRVLQEGEVRRIGVSKITSIDVRVIAATNRNLRSQVQQGLFRQDLLFRLNVLNLFIPPLRARREDIIDLFYQYVKEYANRYYKKISVITKEAQDLLEAFRWEGNVRELKNIAERICVLNRKEEIDGEIVRRILLEEQMQPLELWNQETDASDPVGEAELLKTLLEKFSGSKNKVAKHLGIDRSTLWRKLKKYNIQ